MNFKDKVKILFGYKVPTKFLKTRNSDIFIVSYPKSGNTWLRFLIGNYIHSKIDFNNIETLIPDIHRSNTKDLNKMKNKRFIKSHHRFNPNYTKVVYIKRDVRKVALSYYRWFLKFNPKKFSNFEEFFNAFIRNGAGPYGRWDEHINDWLGKSKKENILVIDYENLKKNTLETFTKILKFCNLPIDQDKIQTAIEKSSFSQMKKLENEQNDSKFHQILKYNRHIPFVGGSNLDENKFTKKQLEMLNQLEKNIRK